jgi:hypothetical protein
VQELDLIWGAAAIAEAIGVTQRKCFHLLEAGLLPARKVGGRWVISRKTLARFFEGTLA